MTLEIAPSNATNLINCKTPLSISAHIIRTLNVSLIVYHKINHSYYKIRGSAYGLPLTLISRLLIRQSLQT